MQKNAPLCHSIYNSLSSLLFGQGFLGQQQQHPVVRVCVSSSPRLVQSPSTCPFWPSAPFFTQPRVFPALGWGKHYQITSNAANLHPKGAHEMLMRMPWGQQGTYYPVQEHACMLSFVWGFFSHSKERAPSGTGAHPPGNNTAGITFSRLQFVDLTGARGSDCPGALCWAPAELAVLTLLAASITARGVSGFQQHKEFVPPVREYPRKAGRCGGNNTLGSQILQLFCSQSRET